MSHYVPSLALAGLALLDHAFAWGLLPRPRDGCLGLPGQLREPAENHNSSEMEKGSCEIESEETKQRCKERRKSHLENFYAKDNPTATTHAVWEKALFLELKGWNKKRR